MSNADIRVEKDSMGDVPVPADKLWGAQARFDRYKFEYGRS